jgi:DNA-binding XRE family transcriptional regulator
MIVLKALVLGADRQIGVSACGGGTISRPYRGAWNRCAVVAAASGPPPLLPGGGCHGTASLGSGAVLGACAASNLRTYRTRRGLSQEKLDEVVGRHRNAIGRIERAEQDIRLSTLERLAGELGLDPFDLQQPVADTAQVPRRR